MNQKILLLIIFLFTLSPGCFFGQESQKVIENWFSQNSRSYLYQEIKRELQELFTQAGFAQIPLELLTELMDEGAAKNVPDEAILSALRQKTIEYKRVQELFSSAKNCYRSIAPGGAENAVFLKHWSSFRNRGIPEISLEDLLAFSCLQKLAKDRLLSVFRGIAGIPVLSRLSAADQTRLGKTLLESSLSVSTFNSLGSLYVKGQLKNIPISEITAIIIDALESGKGLIRIEQEFNRRGRQ
ncbi:MAG: hypothetical protein JW904_14325 [Spirochaetales bacterium]|nr:hypothetical protein [Spirochaetales bacterium]